MNDKIKTTCFDKPHYNKLILTSIKFFYNQIVANYFLVIYGKRREAARENLTIFWAGGNI
jgi:hypothetical protein